MLDRTPPTSVDWKTKGIKVVNALMLRAAR
jgi:hypothetical protein